MGEVATLSLENTPKTPVCVTFPSYSRIALSLPLLQETAAKGWFGTQSLHTHRRETSAMRAHGKIIRTIPHSIGHCENALALVALCHVPAGQTQKAKRNSLSISLSITHF